MVSQAFRLKIFPVYEYERKAGDKANLVSPAKEMDQEQYLMFTECDSLFGGFYHPKH